MYDLYVPEKLYEKEIKKLKEAPAKLIDNKDLNTARRKKEADRLNTFEETILTQSDDRPRQEKNAWFLSRTARYISILIKNHP